jgi:predicted transcriptional regulator
MQDILEFVRQGWRDRRFTAAEIARRTGKVRQTVHKAMIGEVDPPYSVAKKYYDAAMEILEEAGEAPKPAPQEVAS